MFETLSPITVADLSIRGPATAPTICFLYGEGRAVCERKAGRLLSIGNIGEKRPASCRSYDAIQRGLYAEHAGFWQLPQ